MIVVMGLVGLRVLVVVVVVVTSVGEVLIWVTVLSVKLVLVVVVRLMLVRLDVESVVDVSINCSDDVVAEVVSTGSVNT